MNYPKASQEKSIRLPLYIKELRAPFLSASLLPIILGGVLVPGWEKADKLLLFGLIVLCGALIHLASNTMNDYFDFKNGSDGPDTCNTHFSGGSGLLVDKLLLPREVFLLSMCLLTMAALAGFIILYLSPGNPLFIALFGAAGIFLGYAYTAPPFNFVYRGLGEFTIFLAFGPLTVCTAYYILSGNISISPVIYSLAPGSMTTAILWINQFPDYETDKRANKKTLVVQIGPSRSRYIYFILIALTAASLVVSSLYGPLPMTILWALFFILPAFAAAIILQRHYLNPSKLIPAMALTIGAHTVLTLIMIGVAAQ
ncbi:MAG: 1,4-dihydroxy-2-naphthoate octaprenyltransferase [bacterium]|nr:1,4-dihydroxy-2-naphthoate octaprenyltransferase [bacterium]